MAHGCCKIAALFELPQYLTFFYKSDYYVQITKLRDIVGSFSNLQHSGSDFRSFPYFQDRHSGQKSFSSRFPTLPCRQLFAGNGILPCDGSIPAIKPANNRIQFSNASADCCHCCCRLSCSLSNTSGLRIIFLQHRPPRCSGVVIRPVPGRIGIAEWIIEDIAVTVIALWIAEVGNGGVRLNEPAEFRVV